MQGTSTKFNLLVQHDVSTLKNTQPCSEIRVSKLFTAALAVRYGTGTVLVRRFEHLPLKFEMCVL